MENEYFEVDLSEEEKQVILKFNYFTDQVTLKDLHDGRKKRVKFTHNILGNVIRRRVIGKICLIS